MSEETVEVSRVLVIDDHPLLRRGVGQLVGLTPELALAGEAGSGEEGLAKARALDPDIVLLDLNMAGMGGLATLKALKAAGLHGRVIVLTVSDATEDVVAALRAGADGYLLKDTEPDELVARLSRAAAGELVLSEQLAPVLAQALSGGGEKAGAALARLTAREAEILRHLARGGSNKRIARALDVTEGTVKVHVRSILRKLGFRSRVEAAVWAVGQGLK